jgi:hypothetical protein
MRASGTTPSGTAGRVLRHVLAGLLVGAAAGYLAALVLPRRYPAPPGGYRAPIPPSAGMTGERG